MKQSDIKTECDQVYLNIKLQQDKLKRLRSICKHPSIFTGNYSYKIGVVSASVKCSDCGSYLTRLASKVHLNIEKKS